MTVNGPLVSSAPINAMPPTRSTIPVFDLLPSELLVLIISFAVHLTDYDISPLWIHCPHDGSYNRLNFPYTALQVSKRWNNAAIAAPEVWNAVPIWTNEPAPRVARRLDLHWERSGDMPLHVQIDPRHGDLPRLLPILRLKLEMGMRWKSLQIVGFPFPTQYLIQGLFSPLKNSPPTDNSIEELHIISFLRDSEYWDEPLDHNLAGLFPNLRFLHYFRYSRSLFALPNLQYLCMDDVNPRALNLFFQTNFPNLITLAIRCNPRARHRSEESYISSSFHQPNLQSAIVYDFDSRDVSTFLSGVPHFQQLAISSADPFWDTRHLLDTAEVPELSSLTIFSPWKLDSCVRGVVERRLPTLERLTVHDGASVDAVEDGEFGEMMEWMGVHTNFRLLLADEIAFAYLAAMAVP